MCFFTRKVKIQGLTGVWELGRHADTFGTIFTAYQGPVRRGIQSDIHRVTHAEAFGVISL